jgi:hypothetical protein
LFTQPKVERATTREHFTALAEAPSNCLSRGSYTVSYTRKRHQQRQQQRKGKNGIFKQRRTEWHQIHQSEHESQTEQEQQTQLHSRITPLEPSIESDSTNDYLPVELEGDPVHWVQNQRQYFELEKEVHDNST